MIRYETLLLAHPEISEDALSAIEKQFEHTAAKYKGKVLSFDKWGKYRLSYPVKKQDYGSYVLIRFEFDTLDTAAALQELYDFFKIRCADTVLRFINKRLDLRAPLEYTKPEAIVPAERERSSRYNNPDEMNMRSRHHEMRSDAGMEDHGASLSE
jgi:small subunit ribosomal protein S6